MATPSDRQLQEQIAMLLDQAGINVGVDVENGVARLSGLVTSTEMHQAAIDLARMVDGIRGIDDEIEELVISPDSAFEAPDRDEGFGYADRMSLEDDISDTEPDFTGDVGADANDFQRAIEEGEPYFPPTDPVVRPSTDRQDLRIVGGFQATSMDELATEADAEPDDETDEITQFVARDDDDIRIDVLRELREDALTTDLRLEVNVINGIVFLKGTVQSVEDAENAEAVAGRVPGVVEVRDMTEVRE